MVNEKHDWFSFTVANEHDAKAAVTLLTAKGFEAERQGIRVYHLGRLPYGLWHSIAKVNTYNFAAPGGA